MPWELLPLPPVEDFLVSLEREEYLEVDAALRLLEEFGPNLRVSSKVKLITTSRHRNMKELRCSANGKIIRILFAFDQKRRAVLLVGGDKSDIGFEDFYTINVPIADDLFDKHCAAVEAEMRASEKHSAKKGKGKGKDRRKKS